MPSATNASQAVGTWNAPRHLMSSACMFHARRAFRCTKKNRPLIIHNRRQREKMASIQIAGIGTERCSVATTLNTSQTATHEPRQKQATHMRQQRAPCCIMPYYASTMKSEQRPANGPVLPKLQNSAAERRPLERTATPPPGCGIAPAGAGGRCSAAAAAPAAPAETLPQHFRATDEGYCCC